MIIICWVLEIVGNILQQLVLPLLHPQGLLLLFSDVYSHSSSSIKPVVFL